MSTPPLGTRSTISATTVGDGRGRSCRSRSRRRPAAAATPPGCCRARRAASSASWTVVDGHLAVGVASRRAGAGGPARRRSAMRNTLTGASGNTTVPMSRPSTTPAAVLARPTRAGGRRAPRAPAGARRPPRPRPVTSGPRISALTSRPSSASRRPRPSIACCRGDRRHAASSSSRRELALEHGERDRAVHRAGVEHVEPERGGDRRARPSTCPSPTGPSIATTIAAVTRRAPVSTARSSANSGYDDATARQPRTVDSPSMRVRGDRRRHRDAVVAVALEQRRPAARRRGSRARRRAARRRRRAATSSCCNVADAVALLHRAARPRRGSR